MSSYIINSELRAKISSIEEQQVESNWTTNLNSMVQNNSSEANVCTTGRKISHIWCNLNFLYRFNESRLFHILTQIILPYSPSSSFFTTSF
jgi:hypothetical protein